MLHPEGTFVEQALIDSGSTHLTAGASDVDLARTYEPVWWTSTLDR